MEMDPQERESDLGDDSPVPVHRPKPGRDDLGEQFRQFHLDGRIVSPNDDMTDGDSGREQEDGDSGDDMRRHHSGGGILAEHGDVLAKLKMQVRDIKVGEEYDAARHMNFPSLPGRSSMPQNDYHIQSPFAFPHPSTAFMPPMMPPPTATSSGSSHSSEGSASSSQHTWSFEEQFKQVRQLYEISDDPKRKEFLDDLFSFMQKRGTPINRLPIMAKSVLDLFELFNLVVARGGLVDVINKKLWQEIIKGLHLPSSITSAAFTLRTQYMKYLYPYECDRRNMSTPEELQMAIDGNRREGRRASYGYDGLQRSPNQNLSLSLVAQQQQQQIAARLNSMIGGMGGLTNGVHHPSHPPPLSQPHNGGPIHGLAPSEIDARLMEYVKYVNGQGATATSPPLRLRSGSPPIPSLNPLWALYRTQQPAAVEPQQEALNLADPGQASTKRESDSAESPQPPKKMYKGDSDEERARSHGTTNISITNRVDTRNGGSNSMLVSMEINGIKYSGLLFATAQDSPSSLP